MRIGPGTRALVTGASRGIGAALVEALAARGVTLGLAARSTHELDQLAARLPGRHHVLGCDVSDRESVEAAFARFEEEAGGLELVVANAGVAHYGPFAGSDLELAERMTRVNWLGTLYTVNAALPRLLEQGTGHLVIVSSGAALRTFPSAAVYGATKAAQHGFGQALRHELAGTGVSLTVVYPGEIATALHDHEKEHMPPWYRGGPNAAPPGPLAAKVIDAVESDARAVYHPPLVRLLRIVNGVSPRLGDRMLRRMRGTTAAPRVD